MAYAKKPMHSGMFSSTGMFATYRETLYCKAKDHREYVLFTRIGRGVKRFPVNNMAWGLLDSDSKLETGDICTRDSNNQTMFLVAKSNSKQGDKGEFYITNCKVKISHMVKQYDEYDNEIGNEEQVVYEDLDCVYEDISAHMYLYSYGLLATTTKRFILPPNTDVKLLDRITLNGHNVKVDNINVYDFAPFLYVQCSEDDRL